MLIDRLSVNGTDSEAIFPSIEPCVLLLERAPRHTIATTVLHTTRAIKGHCHHGKQFDELLSPTFIH